MLHMNSTSYQRINRALVLVGFFAFLGCQSPSPALQDLAGPLAAASDAYLDYERGDCDRVRDQANDEQLRDWEPTEVRHSMVLVRGFCEERMGDVERARETYRGLIQEAPLSFASDDARERLRVLRLAERDPDYKAWVDAARDRHAKGDPNREPVDRMPAAFPPIAQHAEIEGYAVVEFGVTPRGDTDSPIVVESEPPLLFDGAALRAVREWRYTRDPKSAESHRQVIRIVFQPQEAEPAIEESGAGEPASAAEPATSVQ